MSKKIFSTEEKVNILYAWENSDYKWLEICALHNVSRDTIKHWKYNYETYGIEGLNRSNSRKGYSKELKLSAIKDYVSGNYSQREIIRKYDISSTSVFRRWLNKYNSHSDIKSTNKGRNLTMTKGRSTTWKERIEIVYDCLAMDKNYQETATKYSVSYQQVYQWVRKYTADGIDGLKDGRGRKKTAEELTSEDRMKLEIERIEKENERLRAENAFLKKLEEIERRRI